MNHERFDLTDDQPLEVEEQYLVEVLECLFHHILFHRSLGGKIVPRDAAILNNIFYVKCDDARLEQKVRESAEAAAAALKKQANVGRISVLFYGTEKGFVTNKKVPWEEWVLRVAARTEPAFGRHHDLLRRRELEARVSGLMWRVLHHVSVRRDHLPAVPSADDAGSAAAQRSDDALRICYPFEIKMPATKDSYPNLLDILFSGTASKVQVPL